MSSFLKRWWWVLLLVAIGLGACRLRFDVDILNLLPADEPTVQGLKLYQEHFANARELIITLRAPDAGQAEQLAGELADRLRQQTNLVSEVTWQAPWMEHPEQLGELLGWLWFNQPPEAFGTLTNRLAPDQLKPALEQTKEALATSMSPMDLARHEFDPFNLLTMPALTNLSGFSSGQNQQMFASPDGKFRLLYVESAVDLDSYRSCESWLKAIHAIVGAPASLPASAGTNTIETRRQDCRRSRDERRRGPLHRASGVCGGNRDEHATRHEPFGGHHFHRHCAALLADASALAADVMVAGVADVDFGARRSRWAGW